MQYKIIEEADSLQDVVIEKTGHVIKFTLNEVEKTKEYNKKTLTEIKAKRDVDLAKMHNIEEHHPFVKDMSKEDLFTAWMYQESKGFVEMCDEKIKEFEDKEKELEEELVDIYKQLPELAPKTMVTDLITNEE